jgi:SAM-dependent methyltransferase
VSSDIPCVICQQPSQRLFNTAGYSIRQCAACDHQFAELPETAGHVKRHYDDGYFTGGGAGYSDYRREERLLVHRGRWYARLMARYCRPGSICDVGAAAGFTLVAFRELGWRAFGIEPNRSMGDFARQQFGLDVITGSFEDSPIDDDFDLVTMLQVLPHFIDPAGALLKAARLIKPGGHLLIETWDRGSWTARLLGKSWHEYNPPSVLHWFTRTGLVQLAQKAGFEQVAVGRPSKWIDAAHAKTVLRNKANGSALNSIALGFARLIPDRLALPYIATDLFWIVLRRQNGDRLSL